MNIMYYLLHLLFKKEESRKNNTENFNDNNSKKNKTKTAATTRKPIPTSQMHVERFFQRSYNYYFQKLFLSECSTSHQEV